MALLAIAGLHLFFRLLLPRLSDSWTYWPARDSAGERISSRRGAVVWLQSRFVVCAHVVVAVERPCHAGRPVLGGHGGVADAGSECMAARNAGDLFRLFSFVRERGAGFLRLSVGWHAARSWVHRTFLCSCRIPSR